MQNKLTPQRAAELIQCRYNAYITAQSLGAWIKTGRCPFGEYLRKSGAQRGMYLIFPERMEEYFKPRHNLQPQATGQMYFMNQRGRSC